MRLVITRQRNAARHPRRSALLEHVAMRLSAMKARLIQ
jgi:hypothetical protein